MSKKCNVCLEIKPFSEFYKHKQCKDGYRPDCKKCKKELTYNQQKEWRENNKEEIAKRNKISKEKSKCEHGRRKGECRICSDNPIKYIIQCMIYHSKNCDKKNKYDENNFIDKSFLELLFQNQTTCYYCGVHFEYINFTNDFVTIERINNNIGHTKDNCTLACWKCNNKRLSNQTTD